MANNNKINKYIRVMLAALLVCSVVMSIGCTSKPADPTKTTTGITYPQKPKEETNAAEKSTEETTDPTQIPIDPSLNSLRQAMVETPQVFAVAYLGYQEITDQNMQADPFAIMQENAYWLREDLPFLTAIPQDRIVGENGELYCIVPRDENATVTVNMGIWDDDGGQLLYEDVIYRSEIGEPILLFCNGGGWEPDTQVVITDSDGTVTTWYPQLDDNQCAMPLRNDNWEDLFFDFSPYREIIMAKHSHMKDTQWKMPTAETLAGTTWSWNGYLDDYREFRCSVTFGEDTLRVRWNDGIDETDHEYPDAAWELTYDEGFAILAIDFREMAGVLRYNLLYHEHNQQMYVAIDAVQEDMPIGQEPLYRFLQFTPEPIEMIGTWEKMYGEVEGETIEVEPGTCTIEIKSAASAGLLMSYTSVDYPDNDFYDELLSIDMRELYFNCGNGAWVADVDYAGPWETTYAITLTWQDILIKQNYYLLDGAPTVSYEYFRRVAE